jgi:hypothetical protein
MLLPFSFTDYLMYSPNPSHTPNFRNVCEHDTASLSLQSRPTPSASPKIPISAYFSRISGSETYVRANKPYTLVPNWITAKKNSCETSLHKFRLPWIFLKKKKQTGIGSQNQRTVTSAGDARLVAVPVLPMVQHISRRKIQYLQCAVLLLTHNITTRW